MNSGCLTAAAGHDPSGVNPLTARPMYKLRGCSKTTEREEMRTAEAPSEGAQSNRFRSIIGDRIRKKDCAEIRPREYQREPKLREPTPGQQQMQMQMRS